MKQTQNQIEEEFRTEAVDECDNDLAILKIKNSLIELRKAKVAIQRIEIAFEAIGAGEYCQGFDDYKINLKETHEKLTRVIAETVASLDAFRVF